MVAPRLLLPFGKSVPHSISHRNNNAPYLETCIGARSRRLKILGKRFGCAAVTILAIANRVEAFPSPWSSAVVVWLRVHLEGGVFALAATLLPFPRFATMDVHYRLQV